MNIKAMPSIPISVGELVDKISILKIKSKNIIDENKLININNEFMELQKKLNELNILKSIQNEIEELDKVNSQLWTIEDDIREKEKRNEFDESFINLARSVYKVNDKRAFFKKQINVKTGSLLIEEKSYSQY
tara:strand:+ start:436 stop:831 length:396 start_codon:yes stop_codon:yes gene_type:complete